MRIRPLLLPVLLVAACAPGIRSVSGVYEMVAYQGKPLPFMGMRAGEARLSEDGSFLIWTEHTEVPGGADTTVDTVPGSFGFILWDGSCMSMRIDLVDPDPGLDPFGEICGDSLYVSVVDGLFTRVREGGTSGPER